MYRIETTPEFDEELRDLDPAIARRAGNYRVLLWVDRKAEVLTLYGVRHRREVYDILR